MKLYEKNVVGMILIEHYRVGTMYQNDLKSLSLEMPENVALKVIDNRLKNERALCVSGELVDEIKDNLLERYDQLFGQVTISSEFAESIDHFMIYVYSNCHQCDHSLCEIDGHFGDFIHVNENKDDKKKTLELRLKGKQFSFDADLKTESEAPELSQKDIDDLFKSVPNPWA
jgi:hypothetical protein